MYKYDYKFYQDNAVRNCDKMPRDRGCLENVIWIILTFIVCAILSFTLGSCTTSRESSSAIDSHHVETFLQRMDSVMRERSVVQQDSAWHQLIMREFQSIREKSDTSHFVVTDTAGNVIKERIVINNVREVTNEKDREERQVLIHKLETMDSTITVMQQQILHSDSLLQLEKKTEIKEVPASLSWWQKSRIYLANIMLIVLAIVVGYKILKIYLTKKIL